MKKNQDFTMSFVVEQSPDDVFAAVSNPRAWWSEDIDGETGSLGAIFYYHFKDIHRGTFKVTEFVPGKKVVWHVVQNYFNFIKDTTEWTGTDIVFEIAPVANGTQLRFTHVGLVPAEECYGVCHDSWRFYVGASLRELITKGAGAPNKGDDNVNPTVVPLREVAVTEREMTGEAGEVIVMTTAAAKPGSEHRVRDALHAVARAGRAQAGCLEYSVFRSDAEPNVTICVERWASKAERETFLQSAHVDRFVSAITGAFLQSPSPVSYSVLDAA